MFKSVKYEGFEGDPDLHAKCVVLMTILEDQLRLSADRIAVTWILRAPNSSTSRELGRVVDLQLRDDWTGEDVLHLLETQLAEHELIRGTVRRMRMGMLDRFLDRQVERMKANLALEGV